MKEVLIDWKSINPTSETKEQTEAILKSLTYLLPPESDIRVSIQRFNKMFEAHVVIRSPLGDFAAHSESKDIFALCRTLKKNLKHQIFKHRDSHANWTRVA